MRNTDPKDANQTVKLKPFPLPVEPCKKKNSNQSLRKSWLAPPKNMIFQYVPFKVLSKGWHKLHYQSMNQPTVFLAQVIQVHPKHHSLHSLYLGFGSIPTTKNWLALSREWGNEAPYIASFPHSLLRANQKETSMVDLNSPPAFLIQNSSNFGGSKPWFNQLFPHRHVVSFPLPPRSSFNVVANFLGSSRCAVRPPKTLEITQRHSAAIGGLYKRRSNQGVILAKVSKGDWKLLKKNTSPDKKCVKTIGQKTCPPPSLPKSSCQFTRLMW